MTGYRHVKARTPHDGHGRHAHSFLCCTVTGRWNVMKITRDGHVMRGPDPWATRRGRLRHDEFVRPHSTGPQLSPGGPSACGPALGRRLMGLAGLLLFIHVGAHSGSIRDSDTDCRLCRRFVLPDTYNVPACLFQELIGFVIALTVLLDLVGPIVGVCLSDRVVIWASMPEASVEEDGNPGSRKNDVGSPANCRHRSS